MKIYEIKDMIKMEHLLAEALKRVQKDGTCWCGGTQWQGHSLMRISVSSWATRAKDVEQSLKTIIRLAKEEEAA